MHGNALGSVGGGGHSGNKHRSAPPRAGTSFGNPETNHFTFSEIQIVLVLQSRTGFPNFFKFFFENLNFFWAEQNPPPPPQVWQESVVAATFGTIYVSTFWGTPGGAGGGGDGSGHCRR